jgi:copper homeostasis protein (lipoprotein)
MLNSQRAVTLIFLTLVVLAALPLFTACRRGPGLDNTTWVLTSLSGTGPIEGSQITLQFTQGDFKGNAGCNLYGGKYTATPQGSLTFSEIQATAMACANIEIMRQEERYFQALCEASAYRVIANQLQIRNDAGEILLVYK